MVTTEIMIWALAIFFLRIINISLDTIRVELVIKRKKMISFIISSVASLVSIFAIAKAITSNNWVLMIAYCLGYGVGTVIGITLNEKFSKGYFEVTIISHEHEKVERILTKKGFGITKMYGYGERKKKKFQMLMSIVPFENYKELHDSIKKMDRDAIITAKNLSGAEGFYFRHVKTER